MSLLARLLRTASPPGAAVEIAADRVSAAAIAWGSGGPTITRHAIEPLVEGALVPSLTTRNISDRAAVGGALVRALDRIGRPRRVGLVVPDPIAKVSLVRFDRVPERSDDLDRLIRFQVRKAAPFPTEDAQIAWVPGMQAAEGPEFVVTIARRDILDEYESLCSAAGAHAGIVDLSTFNLANAVLASRARPTNDWLLVNTAAGYVSIAVLRGPDLIFFRSRGMDADDTLADLVHQTAMYYEDRLRGGRFERAVVSGGSPAGRHDGLDRDEVRRSIEARLGVPVEAIQASGAVTFTDRSSRAPVMLDALAPLVGLLLRDREAA
jgi:Tfp pilus assembly PilM family ATPase